MNYLGVKIPLKRKLRKSISFNVLFQRAEDWKVKQRTRCSWASINNIHIWGLKFFPSYNLFILFFFSSVIFGKYIQYSQERHMKIKLKPKIFLMHWRLSPNISILSHSPSINCNWSSNYLFLRIFISCSVSLWYAQ